MTFTLSKSIPARRLNAKTGTPVSEPEATIPYGAVIEYAGSDLGNEKFRYLEELYRCPNDILAAALDGGKIPDDGQATAAKAVPLPGPAANPVLVTLKFEALNAGSYSIARAKVPGGWLVAICNTGLTFYPDAEHSWNGEST